MSTEKEKSNKQACHKSDRGLILRRQIVTEASRGQDGKPTLVQSQQIETSAKAYLKKYKLTVSFENVTRVGSVVRNCIQDGLEVFKGDRLIAPEDDLSNAFRIGLAKRIELLKFVELNLDEKLPGIGPVGRYAIPYSLFAKYKSEESAAVFTPALANTQRVKKIIESRKPIFLTLLSVCKEKIEEVIPGSSKYPLTAPDESGLVRNLIFAYVTTGSVLPLIETEDILANKELFSANITSLNDVARDIANKFNLNQALSEEYIRDILEQIQATFTEIGGKGMTPAQLLEKGYQSLKARFTITSPFEKLTGISESPDEENSIWHSKISMVLEINGVRYRVPLPSTLQILSFRHASANPRRNELSLGSRLAKDLLDELRQQEASASEIEKKQQKLAQLNIARGHFLSNLADGEIPFGFGMSKGELLSQITDQKDKIERERKIFSEINSKTKRARSIALNLLKSLDQNGTLSSGQTETLRSLYKNARIPVAQAREYLLYRIQNRLKNIMTFNAILDFSRFALFGDYIKFTNDRFVQACNTTVVDILGSISESWREEVVLNRQFAGVEYDGHIARILVEAENLEIQAELKKRAFNKITYLSSKKMSWVEKERMAQDMAEKTPESLFYQGLDPFFTRYERLRDLQEQLGNNEIPSLSKLFNPQLRNWRSTKEDYFLKNIKSLSGRGVDSLEIDYSVVPDVKEETGVKDEEAELLAVKGKRRLRIAILGVIAKFAPEELLSEFAGDTENLESFVTRGNLPTSFSLTWNPVEKQMLLNKTPHFRKGFGRYLQRFGIQTTEQELEEVIAGNNFATIYAWNEIYGIFFQLEPEIKAWQQNLQVKLDQQSQNLPRIYKKSLLYSISALDRKIENITGSVLIMDMKAKNRLAAKISQLKTLGLALPESRFKTDV